MDDEAIAPVVSVKSVYIGDLKYRATASIVLCETVEVVDISPKTRRLDYRIFATCTVEL